MQKSRSFYYMLNLAVLTSLLVALTACDRDAGNAGDGRPEATIVGLILPSGEIAVEITIPDKHHAYLDAGREGHLIPVSFDWNLPGQTEAPAVKTKPTGELYKDAGAHVLRGNGRWVFQPATAIESGEVKIRSQICDEIKGICFPPKKKPVQLQKI